jgi:hypothetical protein
MTAKQKVLRRCPSAYCVRLDPAAKSLITSGYRFIVWHGKTQPRGSEHPAIGLGATAAKAWASVTFYK